MNLKKIIKENSFDDLEWISQSRPSLHNKIIFFEPMIESGEFIDHVLPKLEGINEMGDNIRWWSEHYKKLSLFIPFNDYLHHLIISVDGRMVYGGLDTEESDTLRDDGFTEDDEILLKNFCEIVTALMATSVQAVKYKNLKKNRPRLSAIF